MNVGDECIFADRIDLAKPKRFHGLAVQVGIFTIGQVNQCGNDITIHADCIGATRWDLPRPASQTQGAGSVVIGRPLTTWHGNALFAENDQNCIVGHLQIGEHRHGKNEEIYFILEGQAKMTINGQDHEVKPGDFILNRAGWEHGLRNESSGNVKILVIEVGIEEG